MPEQRLAGKIALITGSASGQGEAEARLFAAHGATVVVSDLDDERGGAVARALGDGHRYVHLDVADYDQWAAVAAIIQQAFGRLDVLVNNAGIGPTPRLIQDTTLEDHRRTIDVNLSGVFYGLRAMQPLLAASGQASVVNISSIDGLVGVLGMSSYTASKFGVTGLTKVAAIEMGPLGVRVNSIHPGVIETPMVAAAPPEVRDRLARMMERQPLARMGSAEEVARLALFLASDESSYCTGGEFVCDGGHIAGPWREPA
jgi:3alpha(or 20beta)-hydroxysteroid dehydrogenase